MKLQRGYYDIFVKTCAKYPSNIAVRYYDTDTSAYKHYTYSELYGVCEYITQNLRQLKCNKGIIGLVSYKNTIIPSMIAAAHKCCTTFMFIDPSQNIESVTKILEFTIVVTINNIHKISSELFGKKPDRTLSIFNLQVNFYKCDLNCNSLTKHVQQYSFIAMTSGSTGEPKHIQVPIQCIQPNIDDLTTLFNITSQDVIYFSTPLTFDPSMVEILLACTNGASLLIAPEKTDILFPSNNDNSITFWQTTPSKFFQFSNNDIKNDILSANSTLKVLALGGEPLNSLSRLRELKSRENKTRIFNLYGVTEMSCWACVSELNVYNTIDKEIPLGKCLSETQLIVDINHENKNTGKILLVSNTRNCILLNKSRGNDEENSLKTVDTGDEGEVKRGIIYYRGRRDDTIKRFGHKVNLQVIESTVMQCPEVKTCACLWIPKPLLLVVYFSSQTITSQELANFLKCKLDDKHWPDKIMRVDNVPLNKHGKVSKFDLCIMYEKSTEVPQSLDALKAYFLKELKVTLNKPYLYNQVKDKTFLAIGGTSFLAMSMCNKLSLISPAFSKFILPHLLLHNKTIDEIIVAAQKEKILGNDSKLKTLKRCKEFEINMSYSNSLEGYKGSKRANKPYYPVHIELASVWAFDSSKCIDATPVLFQSGFNLHVTVGSHSGKIIVVDARSGELQGTVVVNSRIEAPVLCLRTEANLFYGVVGTYNGTIVCFSLENIEVIWKIKVESMIKSKAVYWADEVYIASYDGKIRCLDVKSGNINKEINICEQGITADLVLAKNEFLIVGTLLGVCACIHTQTKLVMWRTVLASPVFASPVLYDDDKYVVFAEVNGDIHCRTVEKGLKIWRYHGAKGNIFSSICVKKLENFKWQLVFGCHDSHVYSLCIKNCLATLHWKTQVSSAVYSTPCVLSNEWILAVANDGKINIIQANNGDIVCDFQMPSETFSSPIVSGDYIFIGCRDDCLHSIKCTLNY